MPGDASKIHVAVPFPLSWNEIVKNPILAEPTTVPAPHPFLHVKTGVGEPVVVTVKVFLWVGLLSSATEESGPFAVAVMWFALVNTGPDPIPTTSRVKVCATAWAAPPYPVAVIRRPYVPTFQPPFNVAVPSPLSVKFNDGSGCCAPSTSIVAWMAGVGAPVVVTVKESFI